MRYSIHLSYDGSAFCGWQIQPNAPSVQQALEDALSTLLRTRVKVTGAGRTDTEVNACGYVAHFDLLSEAERPLFGAELCCKLNAILPPSIVVHSVSAVPSEDFHARFSATNREYTYFLHRRKDPFVAKYSYLCTYPLDFELMNKAAELMKGTHDFSCFEKVGSDVKTSVCTVREARWVQYVPDHVRIAGFEASEGDYWYFRIAADRFLRNMVRATVGTLLEVGRGRRSLDNFASLVLPVEASGDGSPLAAGVPASGDSSPLATGVLASGDGSPLATEVLASRDGSPLATEVLASRDSSPLSAGVPASEGGSPLATGVLASGDSSPLSVPAAGGGFTAGGPMSGSLRAAEGGGFTAPVTATEKLRLAANKPLSATDKPARCAGGESAPGHALFLSKVEY